ncbi:MAG: hypothetical protein AB1Z98_17080, partial [Nannocystaceae bacterium]
ADLFAPLWHSWARLWGPRPCGEPHLSNHGMRAGTGGAGVSAATAPFFIAHRGQARLLEMPLTGGVVPPASPQHVAMLLSNALESPLGMPRIIAFAVRQETAEGSLDALLQAEALRSSRIQWTTNADLLAPLLGSAPVPEPARMGPLARFREQMASAGSAPTMSLAPQTAPVVAAPPVVVPPIQVPKIRT